LFKRNHKGIKITPEGEEVFEYVKKSYEDIYFGEKILKLKERKNFYRSSITYRKILPFSILRGIS